MKRVPSRDEQQVFDGDAVDASFLERYGNDRTIRLGPFMRNTYGDFADPMAAAGAWLWFAASPHDSAWIIRTRTGRNRIYSIHEYTMESAFEDFLEPLPTDAA
jgi:hypothetical protein